MAQVLRMYVVVDRVMANALEEVPRMALIMVRPTTDLKASGQSYRQAYKVKLQ